MKTSFVSTYSMSSRLRESLPRLQSELARTATEISTSRHADVGLSLGNKIGKTLQLRHDLSGLEAQMTANGFLSAQLEKTQAALGEMGKGATAFLNTLISVSDPTGAAREIGQAARSGLSSLAALANLADGGEYVFGGIDGGTPPFADFDGAPKLAIDTAFAAAFGLAMPDPQSDPAVADIDAAAMQAFLDTDFADLFADPNWGTTWSSASDTVRTSRIGPEQKAEVSVSANEPALRKLAMAYSMVASLGAGALSEGTLNVVVEKARQLAGAAASDLSGLQSRLGFVEERVASETQRMTAQRDVVTLNINALEGVDPVEAKVKFDTLTTQLEMSYSLTNRMLSLSIMKYA